MEKNNKVKKEENKEKLTVEVSKTPKKIEKVVEQTAKKITEKVKVKPQKTTKEKDSLGTRSPVKYPKKTTKLLIEENAFLQALRSAGGSANITPLYNSFNKKPFPNHVPSNLKTALRACGKKLAKEKKVKAVHLQGSRAFTFQLNNFNNFKK